MMIPRRLLLLLAAGGLIFGLVIFREYQLAEWRETAPPVRAAPRRLAPRFEVTDHHRHFVKFERFLGRQRVVLLFFDAERGAASDPSVQALADNFDVLKRAGIEVVAISDNTPYANQQEEKKWGREFPFPLLTDVTRNGGISPVHHLYGLYDSRHRKAQNGLFLVARDGTVPVGPGGKPLPVADIEATIRQLCAGEWPR